MRELNAIGCENGWVGKIHRVLHSQRVEEWERSFWNDWWASMIYPQERNGYYSQLNIIVWLV